MFDQVLRRDDHVVVRDETKNVWRPAIVVEIGTIAVGRTAYSHRPGLYDHPTTVVVRFATGERESVNTALIHLENAAEYRHRLDAYDALPKRNQRDGLYREPLPDLPIWEEDVVHIKQRGSFVPGVVAAITYPTATAPSPSYSVRLLRQGLVINHITSDDIALIRRGPVWEILHQQPPRFSTALEEAQLYARLGQFTECRFDAGIERVFYADAMGLFATREADTFYAAVLQGWNAVRDDEKSSYVLIRYDDASVGDRIRAATLHQFSPRHALLPGVR